MSETRKATDINSSAGPEPVYADDFEMRRREPEQPGLFSREELIVPPAIKSLRKSVSVIHAVPTKAEHAQGLNSKRLMDACITVAQMEFRTRGKKELERVIAERIAPEFEVRIGELARIANIPGKNYTRLYRELDMLYEMSFLWNVVGEDSTVEWEMKSHFFSSYGAGIGNKKGWVRFSFDPSVLTMVLDPGNWATLSFKAMGESLGTAASYSLYQNAWRYVTTDSKTTAAHPTETWIELLIGKSRYVVEDKDGKRVENYGDFKRRVLMDAIARVNNVPALSYTLELKEIRSGNRVAKLQFKLVPKQQARLGLPMTWGGDMIKFLSDLGYSDAEIGDLGEGYSIEEVRDAIQRMIDQEIKARSTGRKINVRKAYFEGILTNVASGEDVMDHDKIEQEASKREAERVAEERAARAREAFESHKAKKFREGFTSLADVVRDEVLTEFMKSREAESAKPLLQKGIDGNGAMAILRGWLSKNKPELVSAILAAPEDQSFEAWMTWRLEHADKA